MEVEGLEGYDFVGFEYILSFSLGSYRNALKRK